MVLESYFMSEFATTQLFHCAKTVGYLSVARR